VLERLTSPFAPLLLAAARGELADGTELTWSEQAAVTVVLACAGYPAAVRTGDPITGLETCEALGAHVIHAGTAVVDDTLVSAGGRCCPWSPPARTSSRPGPVRSRPPSRSCSTAAITAPTSPAAPPPERSARARRPHEHRRAPGRGPTAGGLAPHRLREGPRAVRPGG